jgi:hypothetical protein
MGTLSAVEPHCRWVGLSFCDFGIDYIMLVIVRQQGTERKEKTRVSSNANGVRRVSVPRGILYQRGQRARP